MDDKNINVGGLQTSGVDLNLSYVVVAVVKVLIDLFFASQSGLAMRATGVNPRMARAQGISTDRLTLAGLALSNALVALAGALFAQAQGGADISMGVGTIVIGLAAVIIGETLLPARSLLVTTLACILGAVLYRFLLAAALTTDFIGLKAQDLNLVTAVLVASALHLPAYRHKFTTFWAARSAAFRLPRRRVRAARPKS